MPIIKLTTEIRASPAVIFDLSRSVELHLRSAEKTREQVIAGRSSGLFELGDEVTWRAKHLGFWQTLTVRITEFDRPHRFVDEMARGIFHSMRHEHLFTATENGTMMVDHFCYVSPLGLLGKFADKLFLTAYLTAFLKQRNQTIKTFAEKS